METAELIKEFKSSHSAVMERFAKTEKDLQGIGAHVSDIEQKLARRGGAGGQPGSELGSSWGASVIDSPEFKTFREGGARGLARIELKTVSTIGSGATLAGPMIGPMVITDPVVLPKRRLTIRDLLAPGQTNSNQVWFPRMTVRQNLADVVSEGTTKPQSDFTTELVQTPVVTIAHFMIASRQALDDAPALQSLIDSELRYGLQLVEEGELLLGDGTGQHLSGLITNATAYSAAFTPTDAQIIDQIALALLQSEQALIPASGVVLNFADWTKMKLTKNTLGSYILGDPAAATTPQLWGLPVVTTPAITAGHFLVGNFNLAAQIFDRLGIEVLLSTEDANNFRENKVTVRCESRLALAVKRKAALIYGAFA
jgi:HK97 family phage major capsid protein